MLEEQEEERIGLLSLKEMVLLADSALWRDRNSTQ